MISSSLLWIVHLSAFFSWIGGVSTSAFEDYDGGVDEGFASNSLMILVREMFLGKYYRSAYCRFSSCPQC